MSEIFNYEELGRELRKINDLDLSDFFDDAKIVDLDEVGQMLVEVHDKMQKLSKPEGLLSKVSSKIPFIGKVVDNAAEELAKQKTISKYVSDTLEAFDKKYKEILEGLQMFENIQERFAEDIIKLDAFITKVEAIKASKELKSHEILQIDRLLTDAKSEIKRKHDSVENMLKPVIMVATNQAQNINELTPVLKNMIQAELKTMAGINSFKDAANMMIALKNSIVSIQKLNIINANSAIVDILENTKTNLLSVKDMEEIEQLRIELHKQVAAKAKEVQKAQKENAEYFNRQYEALKDSGALDKDRLISPRGSEFIELKPITD